MFCSLVFCLFDIHDSRVLITGSQSLMPRTQAQEQQVTETTLITSAKVTQISDRWFILHSRAARLVLANTMSLVGTLYCNIVGLKIIGSGFEGCA